MRSLVSFTMEELKLYGIIQALDNTVRRADDHESIENT